jgi:hypothetical protein
MKKIAAIFCILIGVFSFSFLARAAITYILVQNSSDDTGGNYITIQTFIAPSDKISGISVWPMSGVVEADYNIYLCKGTANIGDSYLKYNCTGELLVATSTCHLGLTLNAWQDCSFGYVYTMVTNDYYYFSISRGAGNSGFYGRWDLNSPYYGGRMLTNDTYSGTLEQLNNYNRDLKFRLVYDDLLFEREIRLEFDNTLIDYWPDIASVKHMVCYVGEDCNLWFSFNDLAVGYTVNLINDISPQTSNAPIASTTIIYTPMHQNKIILTAATSTKSDLFCLYIVDKVLTCGINVFWSDENLFNEYWAALPSCASSCEEMASSSGAFWDDFRYGIECGMTKAVCYMARPSKDSLDAITRAELSLESSFPFTVAFDLLNTVGGALASSSTSTDNVFNIPMIRAAGTSTEIYGIPVLSSSSVSNAIGADNNLMIRQIFSWIGWFAAAGASLFIILKL